MDKRCGYSVRNGVVKSVPYSEEVTRMDEKHDLETEEMWSDIESVESKMTPGLQLA